MGFDRIQRKKRAIQLLPSPSSLKELRGALGSLSCFRRFIPNFADTAKPLYRLLEKQVDHRQFVWSSECETAFQQLKQCLCQAPTLAFPNLNEQFTTDEQGDRPIAFFSRTLTKELLAIVSAVKHFRLYLQGKFTIRTDHKGLTWLYSQKNFTNRRLASWLMYL